MHHARNRRPISPDSRGLASPRESPLTHGFVRLPRDDCGHDRLVPFSCKRRGFCPSCGGPESPGLGNHGERAARGTYIVMSGASR